MIKTFSILILISSALFLHAQQIIVNQLGYFTNQVKLANVPGEFSGNFHIVSNATDEIEYTAPLSEPSTWTQAGQSVRIADF